MAHENMESYYTNNFHVLFHKNIGFANNFTLSDLDGMLPYEREIYLMLMNQKLEAAAKSSSSG